MDKKCKIEKENNDRVYIRRIEYMIQWIIYELQRFI